RIHVLDATRRIDSDDGVGDRRQRHLRALLLLERLRFGALAIGNVGERARHPLRLAALTHHGTPARAKPAIASVVHAESKLDVERLAIRKMSRKKRER